MEGTSKHSRRSERGRRLAGQEGMNGAAPRLVEGGVQSPVTHREKASSQELNDAEIKEWFAVNLLTCKSALKRPKLKFHSFGSSFIMNN